MRILHVPHAYTPVRGGTEYYCQRISEELAQIGHEVVVATADFRTPEGFYRLGVGGLDAAPSLVNSVDVRRFPLSKGTYYLAGRVARFLPTSTRTSFTRYALSRNAERFSSYLESLLLEQKPDVVMATPHLFTNVRIAARLCHRLGIPFVSLPLMHEEDPNWPAEDLRSMLRSSSAVLAASSHEADRLSDVYGVPGEAVFVVGGGVDVVSSVTPYSERPNLILFLGRKSPSKGISLLLDAMRQVWDTHPDTSLAIVGARGPDTQLVDRAIEDLPERLQRRVQSIDDVTDPEKHRMLSQARCLVLPSRLESLGLVILEAWSHETPVVAVDTPVMRSVIDPGTDGLLIGPDAQSAADGIRYLLDEPRRAERMGRHGRRKTAQMTWRSVAERVERAYEFAAHQARAPER